MTIKVTKHGLDDFTPFECSCVACGATMEVTELDDIKIAEFGGARDESGDTRLYIICPDCQGNVVCPGKIQKAYLGKILSTRKSRR